MKKNSISFERDRANEKEVERARETGRTEPLERAERALELDDVLDLELLEPERHLAPFRVRRGAEIDLRA